MPAASEEQCHFVRSCYAILVLYIDLQTTVALRSTGGMLLLQPCHMSVLQQPNAILRWTVSARRASFSLLPLCLHRKQVTI